MKLRVDVARLKYIFFATLVVAIPLISTFLLVNVYLHKHILNYIPQWSDEIYYWHQAATFRIANFNGGYYTVNEIPAPASFIHFYAWGPIYPIILGTLGKIIGWKLNYAPLINLAIFSLAIIWFIITTKPNYRQLLLLGFILLTFWPIQIYMPTNMVVVLSCSVAIVLAAFFHKIINAPEDVSWSNLVIFFLIICLMALFKISWAILFLPYMIIIRHKLRLSILQSIVASIMLIAISYIIYVWITAPYPDWFNTVLLNTLTSSFFKGLRLLASHLSGTFQSFFDITQNPLFLLLRAQMLLVLLFSGYILWKGYKDNSTSRESFVIIINCSLLLIATFLLYDVGIWRDYRLFAPVLLMILILFIARKRTSIVLSLILLNLILLPNFLFSYKELLTNSFPDNSMAINRFAEEVSTVVKFDGSKSAWDNTLLIPLSLLSNNTIIGLPAGIGLSFFEAPDNLQQIKSRYLILDQNNYGVIKNYTCLEFMLTTEIGDLYTNRGNDCKQ